VADRIVADRIVADRIVAEDSDFEASPEHLYFLSIEKVFIELRGSPLALSPSDWKVSRAWHEAGIPFELVEATLREIFERRRARGTERKMTSLRSCRRSVEAAWERQKELHAAATAPSAAPPIDVGKRLEALAAALPAELPGRGEVEARLRALRGDAAAVDEALAELDREILASVEEAFSSAERAALESDLERVLAKLRRRLGADQLQGARRDLREKLLRERLGLPELSLFAPEAEELPTPTRD